jgi:GDP-mannose 6-dehydrogenase
MIRMRIAVFGLGYVGLTTAACLAEVGHNIIGFDVNEEKVAKINCGISPIVEPGLQQLLENALRRKSLRAHHQIDGEAFDIALVCVGTPSASDGSHNMTSIVEVSRQLANFHARHDNLTLTVVYRSTFRPGTMDELILPIFQRTLDTRALQSVELFYNPEFMRESSAISDYFNPPKIVIGSGPGQRSRALDAIYAGIAAPLFYTTYREAELIKLVDNSWHALKVAYANEIGRICLHLGVSATKIHDMFISDTKLNLSQAYLRPGGAFGGSCLPKDLRAIQYIARDSGANTVLLDSVERSNDAHKHFLFRYCVGDLSPPASILLVGLAFKAGTDDLRESPAVDLARKLLNSGFKLLIFDRTTDASKLIGQNLGYAAIHLPTLDDLLVSEHEARNTMFDLVIDSTGGAEQLGLMTKRIVKISALP